MRPLFRVSCNGQVGHSIRRLATGRRPVDLGDVYRPDGFLDERKLVDELPSARSKEDVRTTPKVLLSHRAKQDFESFSRANRTQGHAMGGMKASDRSDSTTQKNQHPVAVAPKYQETKKIVFSVSRQEHILDYNPSKVPLLLLFFDSGDKAQLSYLEEINKVVTDRNEEMLKHDPTALPVVRLGVCEAVRHSDLAAQFFVQRLGMPLLIYSYRGGLLDRLTGVTSGTHINDSIDRLLEHVKKKEGRLHQLMKGRTIYYDSDGNRIEDKGEDAEAKRRVDHENHPAKKSADALLYVKQKNWDKATTLFTEAYEEGKALLARSTLPKITNANAGRLKKLDPLYTVAPHALSGLAIVRLGSRKFEEAMATCRRLEEEFPWAAPTLPEVAETCARVKLVYLSNYDVDNDSYMSLLKSSDHYNTPDAFYENKLKLVTAHYLGNSLNLAVAEALKLIAVEEDLGVVVKYRATSKTTPGPSKDEAIGGKYYGTDSDGYLTTPAMEMYETLMNLVDVGDQRFAEFSKKMKATLDARKPKGKE